MCIEQDRSAPRHTACARRSTYQDKVSTMSCEDGGEKLKKWEGCFRKREHERTKDERKNDSATRAITRLGGTPNSGLWFQSTKIDDENE